MLVPISREGEVLLIKAHIPERARKRPTRWDTSYLDPQALPSMSLAVGIGKRYLLDAHQSEHALCLRQGGHKGGPRAGSNSGCVIPSRHHPETDCLAQKNC